MSCVLCHAKETHSVTAETLWMRCLTRLSQTSYLNSMPQNFGLFFPYMADFELVLASRIVEEIQGPHSSISFSLGSNTSHKTNVLPQKHFISSTCEVLNTSQEKSPQPRSETWSPTTSSPLLCLSTMCPQYGTKFECLAKEAGEGRVGKMRPRSWQKT